VVLALPTCRGLPFPCVFIPIQHEDSQLCFGREASGLAPWARHGFAQAWFFFFFSAKLEQVPLWIGNPTQGDPRLCFQAEELLFFSLRPSGLEGAPDPPPPAYEPSQFLLEIFSFWNLFSTEVGGGLGVLTFHTGSPGASLSFFHTF